MRKRVYSLVFILILFLSSIYVHVSAKMPIDVYANGNKIEGDKVFYVNTSVDINIMYHDIQDKDVHIDLLKNDFIFDIFYEEDKEGINFTLNDDGFYELKVYLEKGDKKELYTFSFCIDKQGADIQFLVNRKEIDSYVYDSPIELEILCDDVNFDVKNSIVYMNNEDIEVNCQQQENNIFVSRILLNEKDIYKIEVSICDLANNISNKTINLQIGSLYDIDYKINDEAISEEKFFYNEDVIFEIQEHQIDNNEGEIEVYINNDLTFVQWIEDDNRNKIAKISLTEEGSYNICVFYKSISFRKLIFEKKVIIDKTKPIIQYRYNDENQKEYISDTRELYIEINDQYFDKNSLELVVKKDSEIYDITPLWTFHEEGCEILLPFYEEGKYEIFSSVKDYAGNVGLWDIKDTHTEYLSSTFIIDWTPPIIELKGINANSILGSKQELTLIAYDDNFDFYEIYATRNGEEYELSIPKYGYKNLSHVQLFEENNVGYYEVYVKAYDLAGNVMTSDILSFTIDIEPPEVFIWLDNKLYDDGIRYLKNTSLDIRVESKDYVMKWQQISIMQDGMEILKEVDNENSHKKFFSYQIEDKNASDSDYQLRIEVMDLAGNITDKWVSFKLNSQSPPIRILNDVFEGIPKQGPWTPQIQYEWEQFHLIDYILMKDNVMIDYVWGTPILEDGEYILDVFARDRAGNNISFSEAFTFVIDNTPPHILIQDVNQNYITTNTRFYHKERLKIQTENIADNILAIIINGKSLDLNAYRVVNGEALSYVIDYMDEGENVIEIKASDLAGNVSHEVIHIFVDSISYIENKTILFMLIFILCSFSISSYLLWTRTCKLHF